MDGEILVKKIYIKIIAICAGLMLINANATCPGENETCNVCNPLAIPLYTSWDTTPSNFYFRINGGASLMSGFNTRDNQSPGGGTTTNSYSMKLGYTGDLAFGYRYHNIRGELAAQYIANNISSLYNPAYAFTSGNFKTLDGMLNIYYDFNNPTWINPYLGLGIGYAYVKENRATAANGANTYSGSVTALAGQGIAGLGFRLNDTWTFLLDYRRFQMANTSINLNNQTSTVTQIERPNGIGYGTNLITVGFLADF